MEIGNDICLVASGKIFDVVPPMQFPRQLDPLLPPPHRFHSHWIGQLLASSKAKHICWPESGARKVDTNSKQKVSIIAEEAGQEFNWQLIELGKHHWQCQVATIQSLLASLTVTLLRLSVSAPSNKNL